MAGSQLTMKLVIDTNSRRVIFAEVDNECVDFLFQILAFPIGNISSAPLFLLTNYPELERQFYTCSYHNYYVTHDPRTTCPSTSHQPINTIVTNHIQGSRVKYVDPVSSTVGPPITTGPSRSVSIKNKKVRRSKRKEKRGVVHSKIRTENYPSCSEENKVVTNTLICGRSMDTKLDYVTPPGFNRGITNGVVSYMVSDDLLVKPMSVISSIILMKELSIKDVGGLKEKVVTLGTNEALKLLKSSLESKSVLTSAFMDDINMVIG